MITENNIHKYLSNRRPWFHEHLREGMRDYEETIFNIVEHDTIIRYDVIVKEKDSWTNRQSSGEINKSDYIQFIREMKLSQII